MKIDVFCHILPPAYFDRMVSISGRGAYLQKRVREIPVMTDLDLRFRMMDRFGDYVQVLSLAAPPIEVLAGPEGSPDLARLANDGMAEICAKHPDRFPGFVASLPLNNVDACLREIDRAIDHLGATGIQIFSNVNGRPLDDPAFAPLFERMAQRNLPIWLHPTRTASFADYATEDRSRLELWWTFGWPYETSVAMARIVFAGYFDRFPDLRIICHHMGAMIPYFSGRIGPGLDQLGSRTEEEDLTVYLKRLKKRPFDYFKMFYADTALFGAPHAIRCGLAFFGVDHVLFATDMPFDPEKGTYNIRETIRDIDGLEISDADRRKIYEGNARRLLRLRR
ncbi:MAG TPA: amidohydrolase family protein [Vicinamibacterales bacterium]|nr:amidohydrolase family protein [Vicinamibacterales bacterium]